MLETTFEHSFPTSRRVASVHAAMMVTLHHLPRDFRADLEQEGLLELWRKLPLFDSRRACWRTFAERLVANQMTSLMRTIRSAQRGHEREQRLGSLDRALAPPTDSLNLRLDIWRVLTGVPRFDRHVALHLFGHSAIETSKRLRVSRASVYRAIERLRLAFTEAGITGGV